MLIRAPGPPENGKEGTCLVASQAYNIAVFVYNRRHVPLVRAAGSRRGPARAVARSDHRVYSCAFLFRS